MASQDNQTKGQGWYGDSAGHAKAGKLGGQKTAETHEGEFYSEIGSKQGKDNNPGNFANNRDRAREAGRKGGEAHGHRSTPSTPSPTEH